jgi:hypothetical protein
VANSFGLDVGDSFEVQNANGKHLHFVIAEASKDEHSSIIIVYISSSNTKFKDNTTTIKYGEHPYITKKDDESWVRYQNTMICLRNDVASVITKHYGKISEDLLIRIQKGFEKSPYVSRKIKEIYNDWKLDKLFNSLK